MSSVWPEVDRKAFPQAAASSRRQFGGFRVESTSLCSAPPLCIMGQKKCGWFIKRVWFRRSYIRCDGTIRPIYVLL